MPHLVSPQTAVVHKVVFELRFDLGHTYLDRAGRIINLVIENNEDWQVDSANPKVTQLQDQSQNLTFTFGTTKLDLSQQQSVELDEMTPAGKFGTLAERFSDYVISTLSLKSFPRIGYRKWFLFPTSSEDESRDRLNRSSLFNQAQLATFCKVGQPERLSIAASINRGRHMVRIGMNPFEQQVTVPEGILRAARHKAKGMARDQRQAVIAQAKARRMLDRFPKFGIVVDFDAFVDDPPIADGVSVSDFVRNAESDFVSLLPDVLASVDGK